MAENQELVGGRYRILGRLGKGAMGVVFMAHDPVLDRKVAIKQMTAEIARNEDLRQRFYVEARAAARLNHPHIITIHELQESDGEIYMVMELLEGKALASLIEERQGPLPLETTLDLIAQVCDGLEYAHQHAIVHRDIKPANIFVASSGVVKILDFGIARLGSLHMTATGALVGTPDYMSPEQVRGDEIDRRTDLWAVGAVLYQMLSGTKPFEAKPLAKLLMAITQAPHVPLQQRAPSVPRTVCDLVDRLLAKPRDGRPATAALVRDELRAILGRDSMVKPAVEVAEEYGETLVVVPGPRGSRAAVPAGAPAAGPASALGTAETVAPVTPPPMPPPPPAPVAAPVVPAAQPMAPAAVAGAPVPAMPRPAPVAPAASAPVALASSSDAHAASVSPEVSAPSRSRLGLVVAAVVVLGVLGVAVAGGAAWWFMGPRLLELAGLRQAPAAPATMAPAGGQAAAPATEAAAPAGVPAAGSDSAAAPSQEASSAVEEEQPVFVPPSSPVAGEARPTQAAAPPVTAPPPGEPRGRAQAQPIEREAQPTPSPSRPRPAQAEAGAPPAHPADAPATHADEPAVTAPRVTDKLTEDTVATLSGQRSQSSYGAGASGSAVAAVNRITWVLQQYAAALQRRDADALRRHRPSPGPVETQWLGARELTVRLENLDIDVNGTSAVAKCRRTVEGTLGSGAPVRESRNVAFALTRQPTGWIITDVR